MFKITNKKYSLFIVIAPFLMIIPSLIFIYFKIYFYKDNRIYSIRKIPEEYRVSLYNKFIDNNYMDSSILILGDSQPNGHRYPTEYIFSTLLAKALNKNILNLAFTDARILDNIYALEYISTNKMFFDAIIFNVNPSHVKQNDFSHLKEKGLQQYNFAIGMYKELKAFLEFTINPNPMVKPNEKIVYSKYENYFDMKTQNINEYIEKLDKFIYLAKQVSNRVVIYITPHSLNAINYDNLEHNSKLDKFKKVIFSLCNKKNIECIEIDIIEDDYYIDIVHFNLEGHKKMSEVLYNILKK